MENGHALKIEDNKRLTASGIAEIEGFTDTVVNASLIGGKKLSVCGVGLKITDFRKAEGVLRLEGEITSLKYGTSKTLVKKLFK